MGPFEKVNFHITGRGGDVVSKLISGGGKRSTKFSDCNTVNIVTDGVEEDFLYKIQIEASEVGVYIDCLILFPCQSLHIFNRPGVFPTCQLTGFLKALG